MDRDLSNTKSSAPWQRLKAPFVAATLVVALACSSDDRRTTAPAKAEQATTIRLTYSSETQGFIDAVIAELEATPLRTSEGPIKVVAQAIPAMWRVNTNPLEDAGSAVWIAPSKEAVAMARDRLASTKTRLGDCTAAFSTAHVAAFRNSDRFVVDRLGDPLSLPLLLQGQTSDATNEPMVLAGVPGLAASGLTTYLQTARLGLGQSPATLSQSNLEAALPQIAKIQERFSHYFGSDSEMLDWVARQDGGQPVIALSTKQQVFAFNAAARRQKLESSPIDGNSAPLEYTACLTGGAVLNAQQLSAAQLLHAYLLRPQTQALARAQGFDAAPDSTVELDAASDGAATALLMDSWSSVYRPLDLSIVIDSSGSTQGLKLDVIKRDLEQLLLLRGTKELRGSVTIISASTKPQIITDRVSTAADLRRGLGSIRSAGGSCVRDAIMRALDTYSESSAPPNRRAIIVFADGPDVSSRVSATELEARLDQMLLRRRIVLYVVGLTEKREDLGELAVLAERVGGRLSLAPVERFTQEVYPIFRELM